MTQSVQAILQEDQQFQIEKQTLADFAMLEIQRKKTELKKELEELQSKRAVSQPGKSSVSIDTQSPKLKTIIADEKQSIKKELTQNSKQVSQAMKAILPN